MLGFLKPSVMYYNNSVYHARETVSALKSFVPNAINAGINGAITATTVASGISLFKDISGYIVTSYAMNQFIPTKIEPTIVKTAIDFSFSTLMSHPKEAFEVTIGAVLAANAKAPIEFIKSVAKSAYNTGEMVYHNSATIAEATKYYAARAKEAYEHYTSEPIDTISDDTQYDVTTLNLTDDNASADEIFNEEVIPANTEKDNGFAWLESAAQSLGKEWSFVSKAEFDDTAVKFTNFAHMFDSNIQVIGQDWVSMDLVASAA